MEERAQEATEFFKSESEHEDDDEEEEPIAKNSAAVDIETEGGEPKSQSEVNDHLAQPEAEPAPSVDVESALEPTEAEAMIMAEAQPMTEAISPTKTGLVTEIVELPKLDLSTLNVTPPSKPSTPRISEAIRRLKDEKSSDVSPSLKGDANMVIDLETGDMFAKKPTGVDDLLQRLIKTRETKKHKTTETVK